MEDSIGSYQESIISLETKIERDCLPENLFQEFNRSNSTSVELNDLDFKRNGTGQFRDISLATTRVVNRKRDYRSTEIKIEEKGFCEKQKCSLF
jgi:hypothetical protein